jgi:KDO2-lipid IV(A) lauroyltransferase
MPWRVLYFIGDCIYVLAYYVIGYRKKVVFANLIIAFPEKTVQERMAIAREFYHNFIDTFIETLKFISISDKEFSKRVSGILIFLQRYTKAGKVYSFIQVTFSTGNL